MSICDHVRSVERLAREEPTVPAEMAQQRRPASPVDDEGRAVGCEREVVNGAVEIGMDGRDASVRPVLEPLVAAVEDDDGSVGRDVERGRADPEPARRLTEAHLAEIGAPRSFDDPLVGPSRGAEPVRSEVDRDRARERQASLRSLRAAGGKRDRSSGRIVTEDGVVREAVRRPCERRRHVERIPSVDRVVGPPQRQPGERAGRTGTDVDVPARVAGRAAERRVAGRGTDDRVPQRHRLSGHHQQRRHVRGVDDRTDCHVRFPLLVGSRRGRSDHRARHEAGQPAGEGSPEQASPPSRAFHGRAPPI